MPVFNKQAQNALVARIARRGKKGARLPKPPRSRHPIEIERQYARELQKAVGIFTRIVREKILTKLPALFDSVRDTIPTNDSVRMDAYANEFEAIFDDARIAFARTYTEKEAELLADKYAQTTGKWNAKQIRDQFVKVLGLNPVLVEPYLKDMQKVFVKENVDLITSISETGFGKVRQIVTGAINSGRLNRNVAIDIENEFGDDISEATRNVSARARLIARDQIAKYNGQLNMARQTNLGITQYEWVTSGDERVRASHRALSGKIFSWDDPPVINGNAVHPGQDFQCRCVSSPLLSSTSLLENTALNEEINK